ncbi:hypothetical protein HPB50_015703 [Hyalomma asiaticum]|uniref:Uncharacterized protein n=1 Tax=Hyalomma asiaticum TaxID=266040 RepID=A0ACB7SVR5_HYAAI|nr:hypothetical protein HPB50_015703 [Hyalomma asiaticum]
MPLSGESLARDKLGAWMAVCISPPQSSWLLLVVTFSAALLVGSRESVTCDLVALHKDVSSPGGHSRVHHKGRHTGGNGRRRRWRDDNI